MSTFCWSRNSIVEDPSSFCGSCCVQDQKEQSANQQLSVFGSESFSSNVCKE